MRKYHLYTLDIRDSQIFQKYLNGHVSNFIAPATGKGPKLYCVLDSDWNIHYIGQTVQSISTRMRSGFKPKGETGYHGYKWRHVDGLYKMFVWFMQPDDHIETIEAEIVYLVRNNLGKWPLSQNEIHFYQSDNKQRELARFIFDRILLKEV